MVVELPAVCQKLFPTGKFCRNVENLFGYFSARKVRKRSIFSKSNIQNMMHQASELILNPDGSIYHLKLRPEHLAPTVLLVGDPDRVPMVSRYFDKIEFKIRKREFVTHTGWLGKRRLTCLSTGIGTDNIDIVLNELDALVSFDLARREPLPQPARLDFLRLGTSGSIQKSVAVDSFLASEAAIGMEGLLRFYLPPEHDFFQNFWVKKLISSEPRLPALPYFVEADSALLKIFKADFQLGITATNTGFYAPQGRQLRAASAVPQLLPLLQSIENQGKIITNLEMETAGIYGLAKILGHRAVSLNCILANRADGTFSRQPEKSMQKMIELALEKLTSSV